jgi:HYDIN/CFA65/VesB-like, Ig-like domain/Abnormal spindle-like microcephaly-assoc'd, ASPM-SPD-2-Hydin/Bacterial TSP3 repeat
MKKTRKHITIFKGTTIKKGILLLIVLAVSLMLLGNARTVSAACNNPANCQDCSCYDPQIFKTTEYPSNVHDDWTDEAQGLAHDVDRFGSNNHWYITSREFIWQVAEGFDLDNDFGDCDDPDDSHLLCTGIPSDMEALNFNHYGDPDQWGGFLFVPVEGGSTPAVAVFHVPGLHYMGYVLLDLSQHSAAWVAFNQHDQLLYSSNSAIDSNSDCSDPANCNWLFRYKVDFEVLNDLYKKGSLITGFPSPAISTFDRIPLYNTDGGPLNPPLGLSLSTPNHYCCTAFECTDMDFVAWLQGGVFSPWGDLILVNGDHLNDFSTTQQTGRVGVHIFRPDDVIRTDGNARFLSLRDSAADGCFDFVYIPGPCHSEEAEGVDWWTRPGVPGENYPGNFHVMLLQNRIGDDNIWLKHYSFIDCATQPGSPDQSRDSDGDGVSDWDEVYLYATDPYNRDTDRDGWTDYEEIFIYQTDPRNPDDFPIPVINIPGNVTFADTCVGSTSYETLDVCNTGKTDLKISSISSSDTTQFNVTSPSSGYPILISPVFCFPFQVSFGPTSTGQKTATLTIQSNDLKHTPLQVQATGNGIHRDIQVTGSTEFGDVCPETKAEKTISICNVGKCDLAVNSVGFNTACPDFTLSNPFPATVNPGFCSGVTIRFTPTSAGPKSCTLVITSDDPNSPTITKTVIANTPFPLIDVPPDQSFLPEVIQSVGACATQKPFPISNKGKCNLSITSITVPPTEDFVDYSLSGVPSTPIILQPGHIAGEGNLKAVFAPTALDRDRVGSVTVTYLSEPIVGTTTDVTRTLCGEGVRTGARVLVTAGGVPVPVVKKIQIQRISGNKNKKIVDTVDTSQNVPLTTVNPSPCPPFQYHKEYGTVANQVMLLPGSYTVTVQVVVKGKNVSKTVAFDVTTCDFNPNIGINF